MPTPDHIGKHLTPSVSYDAFGKNPLIGAPAGTVEMLVAAGRRVVSEPDAAAAALIKQLIHIGTDLYTPCGIQVPFANLVLNKAHTEALTRNSRVSRTARLNFQMARLRPRNTRKNR